MGVSKKCLCSSLKKAIGVRSFTRCFSKKEAKPEQSPGLDTILDTNGRTEIKKEISKKNKDLFELLVILTSHF